MILVTGANGLLGHEFQDRLSPGQAYFASREDVDITDLESIRRFLKGKKIKTIINCAMGGDTESCETDPNRAEQVNVLGVKYLTVAANEIGACLVHFSTDYVFDGHKNIPYAEEDETAPLSVYAKTKLDGEKAALLHAETSAVFRLSWLFSSYGKNFVKTIVRLATDRSEIGIVFDQVGCPSYAGDVADNVLKMIPNITPGTRNLYHLGNHGVCSWYDLAVAVVKGFGLTCDVKPIHTWEYPTKAKRPSYSVLDKSKVVKDFEIKLRHYSDALQDCIAKMKH
jgi:dTDP-4-dehydrorhamnose reductase